MVELFSVALNFNSATQIAALFFMIVKCFCKLITSFTKVDISGKHKRTKFKTRFRR